MGNMYGMTLSEGRFMRVDYFLEEDGVLITTSRRLTPESIEPYRSIEDLNRGTNSNFKLSKNRRSLITHMFLSAESALALGAGLSQVLQYRKEKMYALNSRSLETAPFS